MRLSEVKPVGWWGEGDSERVGISVSDISPKHLCVVTEGGHQWVKIVKMTSSVIVFNQLVDSRSLPIFNTAMFIYICSL